MDPVLEVTKCDCRCSDRIEEARIRLEIWKMTSANFGPTDTRLDRLKECADFVFGYRPASELSSTTDNTADNGLAKTV